MIFNKKIDLYIIYYNLYTNVTKNVTNNNVSYKTELLLITQLISSIFIKYVKI